MADSLDTSACIMAVRNFMGRRGPPKLILSDNGTNMHGAEGELRKCVQEINQSDLQANTQDLLPGHVKTKWRFITPRAPHMGGAWERLVRSVKIVLYACLKERFPKPSVLQNFMIEAESVVNSRPLTYVAVDPNTSEAITPNHLLRMSGKIAYSPGEFEKAEFSKKIWRYSQQLTNEFWKRFVREYLPEITTRTKWYQDQNQMENLEQQR
jgi:hypothetical protein